SDTLNFEPTNPGTEASLGRMTLSSNLASFECCIGHLELEFAGTMPNLPQVQFIADVEGGQVFRIKNADEFFRQNQQLCPAPPPTFLVTKFRKFPNNSGDGSFIFASVWILHAEDYRQSSIEEGLCGSFSFGSVMRN